MFFAAIGDIESNFLELRQVLRVLEYEGIHLVLHTGNICEGPENAQACLTLLRDSRVVSVQGLQDKALAHWMRRPSKRIADAALGAAYAALNSASIEFLAGLPRKRLLREEGLSIALCHGSINSATDVLTASTPSARFQRQRELEPADIIVCGGDREPFSRCVDASLFVCPGVLVPKTGLPRYTLVNTESVPWSVEIIQVKPEMDDSALTPQGG